MATIALLAKMIGIHIFSNYYLSLSNTFGNADLFDRACSTVAKSASMTPSTDVT